jgi:ABC-2 type transport system permease protein
LRWYRVWRVAQRVWTGLYRDRRALLALVALPVGTLLLVGVVLRHADADRTIALVITGSDYTTRDAAEFIEESLDEDGFATTRLSNVEDGRRALRDGDADAYIVLDDAFVRGVLSNSQERIQVGLRGDDKAEKDAALVAIGHALSAAPLKVLNVALGGEPTPPEGPLQLDESYVYGGADYDTLDHAMPALIAFASFLAIFTVALVAFTRERFQLTLERILTTSTTRAEVILGFMTGYAAEALLQTFFVLLVATVVLDVRHAGSLALIALITMLTAMAALNLGMWLSAFARSEAQAMQLLPFVLVPQFVLSGVLFPLASLPDSLRIAAHALPLTYAVNALRDVMIRDFGLAEPSLWLNAGLLLAFSALFLALSVRVLRQEAA